jgi:hypothetical protein
MGGDTDAGVFGETGDRHRGKGWHGAGVAFENNRTKPSGPEGAATLDHARASGKAKLVSEILLVDSVHATNQRTIQRTMLGPTLEPGAPLGLFGSELSPLRGGVPGRSVV